MVELECAQQTIITTTQNQWMVGKVEEKQRSVLLDYIHVG